MVSTTSVLIPWRAAGPERDEALAWVTARYAARHPDWEVVLGTDNAEEEWSKGAAVARAAIAATGSVFVVADADVWSDGTAAAVQRVLDGASWAMPHGPVRRLGPQATARVLAGDEPTYELDLEREQYQGVRGGGLVVLTRAAYGAAPIDPRFRGWGAEDFSWGDALRASAGRPWRGAAVLWHLHHPPANRFGRHLTNEQSRDLATRYRRTRRRMVLMEPLLAEAHDALSAIGLIL